VDFPAVLPPGYPAASHDFTLQAVMHMQEAVGKLTEAVNSLKDQGKDRDRKLDDLSRDVRAVAMDVHAAKAAGRTLLWVIGVVGTLLGIGVGAYFQGVFARPQTPSQISAPSAQR
jgi:hypothetical protein